MSDLYNNEPRLITVRKHWIILLEETIGVFIAGILPFLLLSALSRSPIGFQADASFLGVIASLWLLIAWLSLAVLWTNYYLDVWIVTERHIYNIDQISLFDRNVRTLSLDRIEEISVETSGLLAAAFGYGNLEIHTASPTEENARFVGMPNPEYVRSLILDQIERFAHLEQENVALHDTTEKQEKLIHLVSHEVKGYLTKSAGALAAIAEGDVGAVPEGVQHMAGSALAETRKGVDTVMNILKNTDARTGQLSLAKSRVDLKAEILSIVQSLLPQAQAKRLDFNFFAEDTDFSIQADGQKLRNHVIRNLIDNAIRYTPSGSVRIELTRTGTMIRFSVRDSGVGISQNDMAKLFTEGGHGEHSREVNPDSTGYGLSIAKQIVEAHGGTIRAESAGSGHGSTFVVELPTA